MGYLVSGGSIFFNESPISDVLLIIDKEIELQSDLPNMVVNQNICSIELNLFAESNLIKSRFYLNSTKSKFKLEKIPAFIQNYVISDWNVFAICDNSKKALNEIRKSLPESFDDLKIKDFVLLEEIFLAYGLNVTRQDSLQAYFGKTILLNPDFALNLTHDPWPYQKIGIEWLLSRYQIGKSGALLADFMGLGKTLQSIGVISYLSSLSKANRLVVVPNHLVLNWIKEIKKFAPGLSVLIHRGPNRFGLPKLLRGYDLVVTTYPVLIRDFAILCEIDWELVIADEAQSIKNRNSRSRVSIGSLNRKFSIAVTGTPLEINLNEYWSLIEFIAPNSLDNWENFQYRIEKVGFNPIEIHNETVHLKMRRNLEEVGSQLPPIIPIDHNLDWPQELDNLYEEVRLQALRDYPTSGGFQATLKLRQLTTHPYLLGFRDGELVTYSPKFQMLIDLVDEIFASGESVLVFTAFNEMNNAIVNFFRERFPKNIVASLYGETSDDERQNLVDAINLQTIPGLLVCNVIVAGTGLNIQGANHVIHYNLEWNPAKEDQASYRVIRPGQKKNVFIHRFIYMNTIDEVIDDRLQMRRQLASQVVEGNVSGADYLAGLEVSPGKFRK